jgi:hypothetical protein
MVCVFPFKSAAEFRKRAARRIMQKKSSKSPVGEPTEHCLRSGARHIFQSIT